MEASSAKQRRPSLQDALSTRGGSLALAAIIAIIAAILLIVFVDNYKSGKTAATTDVLVARSLIPRGSSGALVATEQLVQRTGLPSSQVKSGAILDPTVLRGEVATTEILPGQQIVAADFAPSTGGVIDQLSGKERAVAVPVDSTHGLIGSIQAGDHVDVFASFGGGTSAGVVRTLLQNVLVLQAAGGNPNTVGGGNGGSMILQVNDQQALALSYTADFGKVWIVLRPGTGAQQSAASAATLNTVLAGH